MWKLQRNKKGQFTGMLVNENGETKPQYGGKRIYLFTEDHMLEAFKAGLNSHRNSFILPTKQAELYMVGIHAEKKGLAQRKV